jgi:hypothetical protein
MPAAAETAPGAFQLPIDPVAAIDALRDTRPELPPLARFQGDEIAAFDQTVAYLRETHPAVFDATGDHGHRALSGLMTVLQETDPSVITDPERLRPLALEFYRRVGSLASRPNLDPVRAALRPPGTPKPKGEHAPHILDLPAKRPARRKHERHADVPFMDTARLPEPVLATDPGVTPDSKRSPAAWLGLPPAELLPHMYDGVRRGRYNLTGHINSLYREFQDPLAAHAAQLTGCAPERGQALSANFLRLVPNFLRSHTTRRWDERITAEYLVPYFEQFLADTAAVERQRGNFTAIGELGHTKPITGRRDGRTQRAAEAAKGAIELLGREPGELLTTIRDGFVERRMNFHGELKHELLPVVETLIPAVREITGYKPGNARVIAYNYLKAFSRLLRLEYGSPAAPTVTTTAVLPHLLHYLQDATSLQRANTPRPFARALQYSPEEMNGLYEYWVNGKNMPAWAFDGVVATRNIDINERMQMIYDRYGAEIPYLKWLAPPRSIHAPMETQSRSGDTVTLEDFVEGEDVRPEDAITSYEDSIARFANLSDMFRQLPYDDALAVALAYDLPFTGIEEIDIGALCQRLRLRVTDLRAYVDAQLLPELKQAADDLGFSAGSFQA